MNHTEVIKCLAKKLGLSQKAARRILNNKLGEIESDLKNNKHCEIPGLGQLLVVETKRRRSYIPGIDGYFIVPKRNRIRLEVDKELKRQLARIKTQSDLL